MDWQQLSPMVPLSIHGEGIRSVHEPAASPTVPLSIHEEGIWKQILLNICGDHGLAARTTQYSMKYEMGP
jgi:hypothetical protein